jgi:hypothetical protein
MWSSQEREILHELDQFQVTLNHVTGGPFAEKAADIDNSWQPSTTDADDSEATHIAMTVFGYATHIVNVLRILVGSKCESCISSYSRDRLDILARIRQGKPLFHSRGCYVQWMYR